MAYLFSCLEHEMRRYLNYGNMPPNLRAKFAEHEITLAADEALTIVPVRRSARWALTDTESGREFEIELEGRMIRVNRARKGHKAVDIIRDPGARPPDMSASANVTEKVRIRGKKKESVWVLKTLESAQEVLVETMTGEIYRYLIGARQPKIRTPNAGQVLSEFVRYRAVREIFDQPEHHVQFDRFKAAFLHNLDGFVRVLMASIFLEENDLSAQNYGLTITNAPAEDLPEEEDGFLVVEEAHHREEYGEFIKIDHGQSLNLMRIADETSRAGRFSTKKRLGQAPIKSFEPAQRHGRTVRGRDTRTKSRGRKWIKRSLLSSRRYTVTPEFLSRLFVDFVDEKIDHKYIMGQEFQPSILPLYDSRLLCIFDDYETPHGLLELLKYFAIAKIVFTSDAVLEYIASNATAEENLRTKQRIIRAIKQNKRSFLQAIEVDPDWCVFCSSYADEIQADIDGSWRRMTHTRSGQSSARYGINARMKRPFDAATFGRIRALGDDWGAMPVLSAATQLIARVQGELQQVRRWSLGLGSGVNVRRLNGEVVKMPSVAAKMYQAIVTYYTCAVPPRVLLYGQPVPDPIGGSTRVLGTARELCQLSAGMRGRSLTRSRSTGRVFQRIVQLIDDFQDDIQPLTF